MLQYEHFYGTLWNLFAILLTIESHEIRREDVECIEEGKWLNAPTALVKKFTRKLAFYIQDISTKII